MSYKVCKHGLEDIWIVHETGDVRICGWTKYFIGNLVNDSIEDIWRGKKADIFRRSMIDGSYKFCNKAICPYRANEKMDNYLVDYNVPDYPKMVNLAYQRNCNYVCKFCRTEVFSPSNCDYEDVKKIESEVKKMIPHLKRLGTNGAGEIFCSKSIMNILDNEDLPNEIEIETNGSLLKSHEDLLRRIGKDRFFKIMVTVHSFNKETYQFLSGTTLDVANVIDNLKFLSQLRDEGIINQLEIATVVCERNFREMPSYVRMCLDEFKMDTIRLRFFEPYHVMDRSTEWFYDVRNCYHPYHVEFLKIMSDPIFSNPKVWKWQGEQESLQRHCPDKYEHDNVINLSKLILLDDVDERIQRFMLKNSIKDISLYGGSYAGYAFSKILKPKHLFDTFSINSECEGRMTVKPHSELINETDCIVIAQMVYEGEIREELQRLGFGGIILSMNEFVDSIEEI